MKNGTAILIIVVILIAAILFIYISSRPKTTVETKRVESNQPYAPSNVFIVQPTPKSKTSRCTNKDASGNCPASFMEDGINWCLDNTKSTTSCPCYYTPCGGRNPNQSGSV